MSKLEKLLPTADDLNFDSDTNDRRRITNIISSKEIAIRAGQEFPITYSTLVQVTNFNGII